MNRLFTLFFIIVALSQTLASEQCGCGTLPRCPPCNPKAGCRIWGCPCTQEGFQLDPGYEPLNPPRPAGCPKCVSQCDNFAIKCGVPYLACTAHQVATYRCMKPIEEVV